MWRKQINEMIDETKKNLTNMRKMARQHDSEAVEMIALDIEERMGHLVTEMRDTGIFVAIQIGHNGGNSPIVCEEEGGNNGEV